MIRRSMSAALLLLGLLLILNCAIGASSLTQSQIQEFIRQRNIQPLAVEDVGGDVTVILYKDTRQVGCYAVWARNGIEATLRTNYINGSQQGLVMQPAIAVYNPVLDYEVVCLTINDRYIQQRAHSLKVVFSDGNEIASPVQNQGNMILYRTSDKVSPKVNIIIYDEDEKEITRLVF